MTWLCVGRSARSTPFLPVVFVVGRRAAIQG